MSDRIDLEKINHLYDKLGKDRFEKFMSRMGKQTKLYEALDHPVGKEILNEALNRSEALLIKIINEDADEMDRAEFRVLKSILNVWAGKMAEYIKSLNTILEES